MMNNSNKAGSPRKQRAKSRLETLPPSQLTGKYTGTDKSHAFRIYHAKLQNHADNDKRGSR